MVQRRNGEERGARDDTAAIALLPVQRAHGGRDRRPAAPMATAGAVEERPHRHGVLAVGTQAAVTGQDKRLVRMVQDQLPPDLWIGLLNHRCGLPTLAAPLDACCRTSRRSSRLLTRASEISSPSRGRRLAHLALPDSTFSMASPPRFDWAGLSGYSKELAANRGNDSHPPTAALRRGTIRRR